MSTNPVRAAGKTNEKLKVALAVAAAALGVIGFYFFSDKSSLVRVGVLILGLVAATGIAWFTEAGRNFVVFANESVRETKKVVWPERKDALRGTAVVFGFVLIMAVFLWGADKVLEVVLYDLILGWKR